MDWLRRMVVAAAGMTLVALALLVDSPQRAGGSGSAPVTVTNTPLPVSGNVNANVTGTVAVSSLPAVQVSSISGNVPVANPLDTNSNPIPLVTQNPVSGGNAFDVIGSCFFGGSAVCGIQSVYTPQQEKSL